MNNQALSKERMDAIDAHVEAQTKISGAQDVVGLDLCQIYTRVQPVLSFVKDLLFFKPAWQAVLQSLIDALDKMCPKPQ
jgi:hypothetical protein